MKSRTDESLISAVCLFGWFTTKIICLFDRSVAISKGRGHFQCMCATLSHDFSFNLTNSRCDAIKWQIQTTGWNSSNPIAHVVQHVFTSLIITLVPGFHLPLWPKKCRTTVSYYTWIKCLYRHYEEKQRVEGCNGDRGYLWWVYTASTGSLLCFSVNKASTKPVNRA